VIPNAEFYYADRQHPSPLLDSFSQRSMNILLFRNLSCTLTRPVRDGGWESTCICTSFSPSLPFLDWDSPVVRFIILSHCSRLRHQLCLDSRCLNPHLDHPRESSCLAESEFATTPIAGANTLFDLCPLSIQFTQYLEFFSPARFH
jgi:hypothetical protein